MRVNGALPEQIIIEIREVPVPEVADQAEVEVPEAEADEDK